VGDAVRLVIARHFSRLPVYEGSLDHVVGIVHAKDLLSNVETGRLDVPVSEVMRTPFFVPETKKVSDLMAEFRRRKRSIAIVLDEYGGTAGLLTVEDLLEQIVGEIYDEYDVEHPPFEQLDEHTWIVDGKMNIADAGELIGRALPEGDYDTVGGLVYDRLGFVPRAGDHVEWQGVTLWVEALDRHRIAKVRLAVQPDQTPGELLDD
jgi:CBS domain containing-hemolysin-like protein